MPNMFLASSKHYLNTSICKKDYWIGEKGFLVRKMYPYSQYNWYPEQRVDNIWNPHTELPALEVWGPSVNHWASSSP